MFSSLKSYMNRVEVEAGRLGWEISSLITDTDAYNSQDTSFYKDTAYPNVLLVRYHTDLLELLNQVLVMIWI